MSGKQRDMYRARRVDERRCLARTHIAPVKGDPIRDPQSMTRLFSNRNSLLDDPTWFWSCQRECVMCQTESTSISPIGTSILEWEAL